MKWGIYIMWLLNFTIELYEISLYTNQNDMVDWTFENSIEFGTRMDVVYNE